MINDKFSYSGNLGKAAESYMMECLNGSIIEAQPILVEAAMTILSETKWAINPQIEESIDEQSA